MRFHWQIQQRLAGACLGGWLIATSVVAEDPAPGQLYIPTNARAAAYVLARLSDQELVKAPRVEPVFVALLERKTLDVKYREEALAGLVELHHSDRITELLAAFERLDSKEADADPARANLGQLLLKLKPADLNGQRAPLEKLASAAQQPLTRQIAWAALITADGKPDKAWEDAAHRADVLNAIPLVGDAQLRTQFAPKLAAILKSDTDPDLRRRAIAALPLMKGQEAATFGVLGQLIRDGTDRAAAVRAMLQLPRDVWPKDQAAPLVQSLVEAAGKAPVDQRTSPEFLDEVQLARDLSMLMPADEGKRVRKTLGDLGVAVHVVKTIREQMLYDRNRLVVEAGKPVEIILENNDSMPHNLVITAPGAIEEIGLAAEQLSPTLDALGRSFIPNSPKILWASKLVQPDQREKLAFMAPTQTGEYPYVCTYPGHWRRMNGTMIVTTDVEEYLAKAPAADTPKITEWTPEDFAKDWEHFPKHRSFTAGQKLFTSVGCVQCHQITGEGRRFGPNLAGLLKKFGNDKTVLQQILDPSEKIDDPFHPISIETTEGDSLSGLLLAEDAETLMIQTGPTDKLIQKLKKTDIKSRRASQLSVMPAGLLNILSKEQIFDLLAYIESEGNADNAFFQH